MFLNVQHGEGGKTHILGSIETPCLQVRETVKIYYFYVRVRNFNKGRMKYSPNLNVGLYGRT